MPLRAGRRVELHFDRAPGVQNAEHGQRVLPNQQVRRMRAQPLHRLVRDRLRQIFEGQAQLHPDLRILTGLRPGAELLAAEAAVRADVPYVAVLGFPDQDRNLTPGSRARFADLLGRAADVVRLERKSPKDRDEFIKAMRRRDVWLSTVADEAILVWDERDDRLARLFSDLDVRLGAALLVLHP